MRCGSVSRCTRGDGMNDDFLKEVFKETNAHIRATEQKSLILTGAFVGFYLNGFLSVLKGQGIAESPFAEPWLIVTFHVALLFIGVVVYVMQLWYRAWKEHYMDVCLELRKHFVPAAVSETPFPYWIRLTPLAAGRFSVDNLIMYVTFLVNLGVLALLAYDIHRYYAESGICAIIGIAAMVLAYLAGATQIHSVMRNPAFLRA